MTTKYLIVMYPSNQNPTLEFKTESMQEATTFFMELLKKCRTNFLAMELLEIKLSPSTASVRPLIHIGQPIQVNTPKSSILDTWHS